MKIIAILFELLLILGGAIACSGLIAAKRPDAEKILARIAPFQALIGLAMIGVAIIFFVIIGPINAFKALKVDALPAAANLVGVLLGIVLGFLLALPQIVRAAPNAEQRANELAQKIIPFQILIGIAAAGCGVIGLLYTTGLMGLAKKVDLAP